MSADGDAAGQTCRRPPDSFARVSVGSPRRARGIAIVAAAEEERHAHPDRPIHVGIGINGGQNRRCHNNFKAALKRTRWPDTTLPTGCACARFSGCAHGAGQPEAFAGGWIRPAPHPGHRLLQR